MVAKELRLHLATGVVAGLGGLVYLLKVRLHPGSGMAGVPPFFGLMTSAIAGITAVGSERRWGTQLMDVAAVPIAWAWRVKAGVALGLAVLLGVLLPVFELALSPGLVQAIGGEGRSFAAWALMGPVVAALGMWVSGKSRDMSRAFVMTLLATAAMLSLIGAGIAAGSFAVAKLVWVEWARHLLYPINASPPRLRIGAELIPAIETLLLLAPLVLGIWTLLIESRRGWLPGARRLAWRPAVVVLLTSVAAGAGQVLTQILG